MDANRFKRINDIYGHNIGDNTLKIYSNVITNAFSRESDCPIRHSGDEFVVILNFPE
jgi:diguanylate cyclase (GGDEF)-like protein